MAKPWSESRGDHSGPPTAILDRGFDAAALEVVCEQVRRVHAQSSGVSQRVVVSRAGGRRGCFGDSDHGVSTIR